MEAFNSYCWIHSTYFVTGAMMGTTGVDVAAAGIAPSRSWSRSRSHGNRPHHPGDDRYFEQELKNVKYYQWVVFVLILQVSRVFFAAYI